MLRGQSRPAHRPCGWKDTGFRVSAIGSCLDSATSELGVRGRVT